MAQPFKLAVLDAGMIGKRHIEHVVVEDCAEPVVSWLEELNTLKVVGAVKQATATGEIVHVG